MKLVLSANTSHAWMDIGSVWCLPYYFDLHFRKQTYYSILLILVDPATPFPTSGCID